MEASALQLRQGIVQGAGGLGGSLLRLRSDEQLVTLFRAGNDEAFRVIHDRYRKRLLAYARQMLAGSGQDAEDALQDVFERAYSGLRASDRDLALKAWLYRVAHNRCIDQLRRPLPLLTEPDDAESRQPSPAALAEQRDTLRRLIVDVQRLPEQQRSVLLLREMSGMSYAELAAALGVSIPAIKSLLVRARMGLLAANEARETACSAIREELVLCHDRGVRPSGRARRHLRDCDQCGQFRRSMRGVSRNLTAITPAAGPVGILIKLLGGGGAAGSTGMFGSGGAAAGGAAAGGAAAGGAATGGAVGAGAIVSTGAVAGGLAIGANHVTAILAAALATAGGAVAVQSGATHAHARPQAITAHQAVAMPYGGAAPGAAPASSPVAPRYPTEGSVTIQPAGSSLPSQTKSGATGSRAGKSHSAKTHSSPASSAAGSSSSASSSTPSTSSTNSTPSGTASSSSSTSGSPSTPSSGSSTTGSPSTSSSDSTSGTTVSTQSSGGAAIPGNGTSGSSGSTTSGSTSGS